MPTSAIMNYNRDLKYATNASGSWVTTTVEDGEWDTFGWPSIALDTSDHAHISYFDWVNEDLKYATNVSGSWVTTIVNSNEYIYGLTSLALDTTGNAHISYFDDTNGEIKYATNKSGHWVTEAVATDGYVGWYTSLSLDASGRAHISYHQVTLADLMYASSIHTPTVITKPATNFTSASARLHATINARRLQTQAWFEWSTNVGGPYYRTSPKKVFSGETNQKYSYKARELYKTLPYYYRVAAENEDGISYGDEELFVTK